MNVAVGGVALVPGADADVDVSAVVNGLVTRRVTLLQKRNQGLRSRIKDQDQGSRLVNYILRPEQGDWFWWNSPSRGLVRQPASS